MIISQYSTIIMVCVLQRMLQFCNKTSEQYSLYKIYKIKKIEVASKFSEKGFLQHLEVITMPSFFFLMVPVAHHVQKIWYIHHQFKCPTMLICNLNLQGISRHIETPSIHLNPVSCRGIEHIKEWEIEENKDRCERQIESQFISKSSSFFNIILLHSTPHFLPSREQ